MWFNSEFSLKDYDHLSAKLHAWCIEKGAGVMTAPKAKDFIAVEEPATGTWMRAIVLRQVSDRLALLFRTNVVSSLPFLLYSSLLSFFYFPIMASSEVDVFFVDTGSCCRVKLSSICRSTPPMLNLFPARALKCNMEGVRMVSAIIPTLIVD